MKYTHGGIEITMNEHDASFTAHVGGKFVRKSSLPAMKKHIDAATKNAFQEFVALTESQVYGSEDVPGTKLRRVKIKGVEKRTTGYGARSNPTKVFIGFDSCDKILKDCPETIKAHQELAAHEEETERILGELFEQQKKLREELWKFEIDPNSFA